MLTLYKSVDSAPLKEFDGVVAADLNLTFKHLSKGVRERLRGMQAEVILKEVNISIARDSAIPDHPKPHE